MLNCARSQTNEPNTCLFCHVTLFTSFVPYCNVLCKNTWTTALFVVDCSLHFSSCPSTIKLDFYLTYSVQLGLVVIVMHFAKCNASSNAFKSIFFVKKNEKV